MTPTTLKPHLRLRDTTTRAAFTMVELQVAIILLAFGVVTLASLLTTESRLLKRLRGNFVPDSTVVLTRSIDPWVLELAPPARITAEPLTQTPPPGVTARNTVSLVTHDQQLVTESMTATVDLAEIP